MTIKEQIVKLAKEHLRIHPEGKKVISNLLIWLLIINGLLFFLSIYDVILGTFYISSILLFLGIVYFFRNPVREVILNEKYIYAPVDGKITSIEEVVEMECFNKPFIQVSISLAPLDVHVTRMPVSAEIKYNQFHLEDNLLAWHQILSHKESTTVAFITEGGKEILLKQSGGAVVSFAQESKQFNQGDDLGFIKFGSRVDLFLPLGTEICVKVGERMLGNKTILAKLTSK